MENKDREERYAIDLNWYQTKGRSFALISLTRMCEQHQAAMESQSLPTDEAELSANIASILSTIRDCCSQRGDFITPFTPLAEAIFRLFLANNGEPLSIAEIQAGLNERMGYSVVATKATPEVIRRLLEKGRHYRYYPIPSPEDEGGKQEPEEARLSNAC